jgi:CheY-like chemotaxis protein
MTGAELAEVIRREWPDTPIVLVSGYAELPSGLSANISRLNKPFSIADLARVIEDQRH